MSFSKQISVNISQLSKHEKDVKFIGNKHPLYHTNCVAVTAGRLVSLEPTSRDALEKLSSLTRLLILPDLLPWLSSCISFYKQIH